MKLEIPTGSYNPRRYGKPWCAKLTLPDKKFVYEWGTWIGDDYSGVLILDVNPSDVFCTGQKDHRGNKTDHNFYFVNVDMTYSAISKVEAYKVLSGVKNV